MTNIIVKLAESGIDINILTDKKQQTDYKIKYVSEYVKQWAIISSERTDITNITFIDCMCNAGIYKDGDLCTGLEVLLIFNDLAGRHQDKTYNLYLNDYDIAKINILKKVVPLLHVKRSNIKIFISTKDVNEYLSLLKNNERIFGYSKSVVLYVDPYDFGTVHIPKVHDILKYNYCELIFNFFISDYVRNWKINSERISKCLGEEKVSTKEELVKFMEKEFITGHIKYGFSYQFKTETNIELYQIMFFTPNKRGLEVLKDALWKVFGGKFYHRNQKELEKTQTSLFTEEYEQNWLLDLHAKEAKKLLLLNGGKIMTYSEIEMLLIEKSMVKEGQIISHVLKPLIEEGKIIKQNLNVSKRNYKLDSYEIGELK